MAIRRTLAQFSDEIVAADLADDSVTTAKIADSQITAAKVAADVATQAELNVVSAAVDAVDTSAGIKPHIRPGVLYPAVAGKLLDGTTSHGSNGSTAYGTAQADGFSYYYTDIKGSKPIKDPRIGAHFGSQRHKFGSVQLLEQETATNGSDVYSVDGREWLRLSGTAGTGWNFQNNADGINFHMGAGAGGDYIEITGYFNDLNIIVKTAASRGPLIPRVNGTDGTGVDVFEAAVATPLSGRYVGSGSVSNVTFSQGISLGINTVRLTLAAANGAGVFGIELIAQDTSSDANKVKIQIPSQNVVSYGKKFSLSATAQHYDPFNGFTNGSSVTAYVDTATSLGVEGWKNSSTYYRPYNGGRVVRWVDSSGVIKTSVNMMPPNARSIGNSSSLTNATAKANASIANNTFYPTMEAGTIDHSLAEVAKTFHYREFGNGSANGHASYPDASMLTATADDIAYVMDDGLTSLSGNQAMWNSSTQSLRYENGAADDGYYFTFIGTGFSYTGNSGMATNAFHRTNLVQNLPYGTHIVSILQSGTESVSVIKVDGVTVLTTVSGNNDNLAGVDEVTFHQPKMPPIPEDACILMDVMLMADFVPQSSAGATSVSKGSRIVDCSRDILYDASSGSNALSHGQTGASGGFKINSNTTGSAGVYLGKVPAFGTNFLWKGYDVGGRGQLKINGSNATQTTTTGASFGHVGYITSGSEPVLGVNTFEATNKASQELMIEHFQVASPIHTSSHYQTFETPYLHELVGGDRNMEQTNLVVTPDGKTWDEVTRDVSYIGNTVLQITRDGGDISGSATMIFDFHRGNNKRHAIEKRNFAYGYDRIICLIDGEYNIEANFQGRTGGTAGSAAIWLNGAVHLIREFGPSSQRGLGMITTTITLKRGDYMHFPVNDVEASTGEYMSWLTITKHKRA